MICGLHKEQIGDGSGNGGAGVDMLPKDHRGLAGKDVTEYPSSHAGDDTMCIRDRSQTVSATAFFLCSAASKGNPQKTVNKI